MENTHVHHSVLLQEVINGLGLPSGSTYFDGTLGGGGHSEAICRHLNGAVRLLGIDADSEAVLRARERITKAGCTGIFGTHNFRESDQFLTNQGIGKEVDGALLDIGLSSFQLDSDGRGFSFRKEEPLIMSFSREKGALFAEEVVNDWGESELTTIIRGYGEEQFAGRIVREIAEARKKKRITSTKELADIIYHAVPLWYRRKRVHPATKTFQAIRIAVNDELSALEEGIEGIRIHLAPSGRLAVITFHSLEDRIIKRAFRQWEADGFGSVLTKKPTTPFPEEIEQNPRARSAKLRIIEKL